jgi:signal transduction histidine kinase
VNDTGIGIPQNMQKYIFDAFRKIEDNKRIYRGTGVGLTLVKNLSEKLGGNIKLKSKVNQGSSFTIEMPVSPL